MSGVLVRGRRGETQAQRRSHVEMEAGAEGMRPHAQGRLEPPDAGRGRKEPPLVPGEGAQPRPPGPQSPTWNRDVWSP